MEGCFTFQWGVCFSDWGASFLSGVCAHGVIGFDAGGGGGEKNDRMGGGIPPCPLPTHYGKPCIWKILCR